MILIKKIIINCQNLITIKLNLALIFKDNAVNIKNLFLKLINQNNQINKSIQLFKMQRIFYPYKKKKVKSKKTIKHKIYNSIQSIKLLKKKILQAYKKFLTKIYN